MPPELGHNRSISERNEFFKMAVGGQDNPLIPEHIMNEALDDLNAFELLEEDEDDLTLETNEDDDMYLTPPIVSPRSVMELEGRFRYESDDESVDPHFLESQEPIVEHEYTNEQIRLITRNATIILLRNLQASMRFMRVDVHRQENEHGANAITTAMRVRIEDMERMIDAFEDHAIVSPRRLFQD